MFVSNGELSVKIKDQKTSIRAFKSGTKIYTSKI